MGDNNRQVKEKMIELFGAECFIEKLHLRKDDKPRKYRSKSHKRRMKELTYHHIKEKQKRWKGYCGKWCVIIG